MKIRKKNEAKLLRAELRDISRQCRKCPKYPGSEELCADCELLARSLVILQTVADVAQKSGVSIPSDCAETDADRTEPTAM